LQLPQIAQHYFATKLLAVLFACSGVFGVKNSGALERMNLDFITDFSESRNQSGFIRVWEREFWRVSANTGKQWRIVEALASLLTVSLTVAIPHGVTP
jgi:hypothetical protein